MLPLSHVKVITLTLCSFTWNIRHITSNNYEIYSCLSCLPTFTLVYLCLLVFTYVYHCLHMFTTIDSCMFTLFIIVHLLFNLIYYYITRVRVGKPERGSMEAFIFHRNIIYLSDECDQSKSSVCVVLVLVLVSSW